MKNPIKTNRYAIGLSLLVMALSACVSDQAQRQPQPETRPAIVGAERDAHGCIGSAGYSWCAREKACVRPWELAKENGFETSAKNFERFCSGASK